MKRRIHCKIFKTNFIFGIPICNPSEFLLQALNFYRFILMGNQDLKKQSFFFIKYSNVKGINPNKHKTTVIHLIKSLSQNSIFNLFVSFDKNVIRLF